VEHRTIELDPQVARQMPNGSRLRNFVSIVRTDPFRPLSNVIMGALDALTAMSTQALNIPVMQAGLKSILLNNAGLWEALRRANVETVGSGLESDPS